MRTYNLLYRREGDIEKFVEENGIEDSNRLLIQVFTGIPKKEHIEKLQSELRSLFQKAGLIGATTGGEVFEGRVYENTTVLSFTYFDRSRVKVAMSTEPHSLQAGREVSRSLMSKDTKLLFLLADGLYTNGDDVLEGVNEGFSHIPVVGGLAGDNFAFRETYVFTLEEITDRGVVGASIDTDKLHVNTHYNLAWMPIGREMEVTLSEKNRIYEIEGKPVIDIYREYLGAEAEELMPHLAIEFPLILERDGALLARACLGITEDGAMLYTGAIRQGERVRFGICDTGVVVDSASANLSDFKQKPREAIFVYTCLARKYTMGNEVELESKYLQGLAPTSGFLTYGEFYNYNGKNRFMNYTFTATSISEGDSAAREGVHEISSKPDKELIRLRALVTLVNTITGELKEANAELERLAERDALTGLYNRRKMLSLLEEQLSRSERYEKPFCVLMADIDNFKSINDTYGHQAGDEVLVGISRVLSKSLRSTDMYSRWGGEEFLVLMPETELEGGVAVAEKLRIEVLKFFNDKPIGEISISVGLTAYREGDCVESLLSRADRAMYIAKHRGKNLVAIS